MQILIMLVKEKLMDEALIIEIWDTFKDYIHEKSRESAASQFVDMLIDRDVEASVLKGLIGYDGYLDDAIHLALSYNDEDDDYAYDEDDYNYEDDED